jgi:hypothetical protein
MQTSTLIEASAEITRIVTLKRGDVYKRLPGNETYNNRNELRFGIVQDVLNNGADTAITAIEFAVDYRRVEPEIKTFRGTDDVAIWSASPAEVVAHLGEVARIAGTSVSEAEKELERKRVVLGVVQQWQAAPLALTAPETVAVSA